MVVNKTHILENGRHSIFKPCTNSFELTETFEDGEPTMPTDTFRPYCDSFAKTKNNDKIALSIENAEFLSLLDKELEKDCEGSWKAPLPFKKQRPQFPNNRPQALKRAKTPADNLRRNSVKRRHFTELIEGIFTEPAPSVTQGQECWYLPLFGVYHPQMREQIRGL